MRRLVRSGAILFLLVLAAAPSGRPAGTRGTSACRASS